MFGQLRKSGPICCCGIHLGTIKDTRQFTAVVVAVFIVGRRFERLSAVGLVLRHVRDIVVAEHAVAHAPHHNVQNGTVFLGYCDTFEY